MTRVRPRARLAVLLAVAGSLALAWTLLGPAGVAVGHSGLVAVVPADDGSEVRLVFSEALEARFSGADLVGSTGSVAVDETAHVDPSDPRILVVSLPAGMPPGAAIAWRALSAADGHVTSGTIPIPVGGELSPSGARPTSRGHTAGHLSAEVIAKVIAFAALLVAFGLLPFGRLVVRPTTGIFPRGFALAQANGLLIAGIGAAVLLGVTEQELVGAGEVVDPFAYVAGGRIGILLGLRTVVPITCGLLAARLVRRGDVDRASAAGAAGAAATLVLTALSGHAAAYLSPVPVVVDVVHLGAASIWLGGLIGLAGLIGSPNRPTPDAVRAMVPRFSGLALGATAILGLTGLYAAWLTTEDWTRLDSAYALSLAIKVAVVATAFGLGALNFLDGGRDLRIGGGLDRRLVLEAGAAFMVVVATAQLTSTDPPGLTRPVSIAQAGQPGPVSLALAPGRAGPNLVVVTGPVPVGAFARLTSPDGAASQTVELGSLDALAGTAVERIRAQPGAHVAATVTIPAGRWEIAIYLERDGPAVARFDVGLDGAGVTAGRLAPAVPPPLLVAIGLILLAALGAAGIAFRVRLPHVDAVAGRVSFAGLAVAAGVAGLAILIVGPRI